MTVAELIAELQKLPPDAHVVRDHEVYPEIVDNVELRDISDYLFVPAEAREAPVVYLF